MSGIIHDEDEDNKRIINDIIGQQTNMTKYESEQGSDEENARLRPSIDSSSKLTDVRSASKNSGNVKAKIQKAKKKKNEVSQPLAQDVILGKVDYDGSMDIVDVDESDATQDHIVERNDDM